MAFNPCWVAENCATLALVARPTVELMNTIWPRADRIMGNSARVRA